jgi:hypothetical protein
MLGGKESPSIGSDGGGGMKTKISKRLQEIVSPSKIGWLIARAQSSAPCRFRWSTVTSGG